VRRRVIQRRGRREGARKPNTSTYLSLEKEGEQPAHGLDAGEEPRKERRLKLTAELSGMGSAGPGRALCSPEGGGTGRWETCTSEGMLGLGEGSLWGGRGGKSLPKEARIRIE